MKNTFRLLRADEIDVRVGNVNRDKGFITLLLYKDARCDMNILDETFGAFNWTRSHSRENANCTVSIWDKEKQQWISKEDTGTESNTEAEKGLASDSFKRACVNWGIGRELYTSPFIRLKGDTTALKADRYNVDEIDYDENRQVKYLVISNSRHEVVYSFGSNAPKAVEQTEPKAVEQAEPKEVEQIAEPEILCENCHKPIKSKTIGDGRIMPPAQVATLTKEKYGKCLCSACAYLEKKKRESA